MNSPAFLEAPVLAGKDNEESLYRHCRERFDEKHAQGNKVVK